MIYRNGDPYDPNRELPPSRPSRRERRAPALPPPPGTLSDGPPPQVGDLVEANLPPGLPSGPPVPLVRGVAMPRWATMPLGLTGERMPHGNRATRV